MGIEQKNIENHKILDMIVIRGWYFKLLNYWKSNERKHVIESFENLA